MVITQVSSVLNPVMAYGNLVPTPFPQEEKVITFERSFRA